jgi:2-amino-4-hydroxy-6-hydroxymethyldihydropteridine diphosphokinase
MNQVFLSLGSNIGNRKTNLNAAIKKLLEKCVIIKASSIYETEPWGKTNQPSFYNQVLEVTTHLTPDELLEFIHIIERQQGRKLSMERYLPRPIDIDILFYNNMILTTETLMIPHPQIHNRNFVLIPLADIAPDLKHPVLGKTISKLIARSDDKLKVSRIPQTG